MYNFQSGHTRGETGQIETRLSGGGGRALHDDLGVMDGFGARVVGQDERAVEKDLVMHADVLAQDRAVLSSGLKGHQKQRRVYVSLVMFFG